MRIALVCHARHPIAAPFAGGLEAQCWTLGARLQQRGHDVVLFASGDSDARFEIEPIVDRHVEHDFPGMAHNVSPLMRAHVDFGYETACARIAAGGFDVVHNNSLHHTMPRFLHDHRLASVTSLHTPPVGGLDWFVRSSLAPWHAVTTVSHAQATLWWPDGVPESVVMVPNGIDLALWRFVAEGDGSAVWSGRMVADKAPHLAIQAARLAGMPLTLIGAIEDAEYIHQAVTPLLGDDVRHLGVLHGAALSDAIGRASVLLSTPMWPEPFGLSAIEAMACGVPVAAFDLGAVSEVTGDEAVRFARPGDVAGLAGAIRAASRLDRRAARHHVETRYGLDRMVDRYETLYDSVRAAGRAASSEAIRAIGSAQSPGSG